MKISPDIYFILMMQRKNLKLRTLNLGEGDLIAWHHEKSGLFSVKSVYRLALNFKQSKGDSGNSSGAMNEERSLWNIIFGRLISPRKLESLLGGLLLIV